MEAKKRVVGEFVLTVVEAAYLKLSRQLHDQRVAAAEAELEKACRSILDGRDLRGVEGRFDVRGEDIVFIPKDSE